MKGREMISNDIIDKIDQSIKMNTVQWSADGSLLHHQAGIYIGNFDDPKCMIIHIGKVKYGVTSNTIELVQAQRLSKTIMEIYNRSASNYVKSVVGNL